MAIALKPGTRLFSDVCTTELIVVRTPSAAVDVTIGGCPPVTSAADRSGSAIIVAGHGGGTAMGKRYVDERDTLELLCTKQGEGVAALDGVAMVLKDAKPLPASD